MPFIIVKIDYALFITGFLIVLKTRLMTRWGYVVFIMGTIKSSLAPRVFGRIGNFYMMPHRLFGQEERDGQHCLRLG